MSVVGIVAALSLEAGHLGRARSQRRGAPLAVLADGTLLAVSGIGPVRAAIAARSLVEAGATALVSFGTAGGLDPSLGPGVIVLPGEVISRQGGAIAIAPEWRERLRAAIAAPGLLSGARLLSSAHAIESIAEKAAVFRETGAVAVDMETLAIAEVAAARGLEFLAVRVILDAAGDALPGAVVSAADAAGRLHLARLIGALAAAPGQIPEIIRLAVRYRAASRALSAVARSGALTRGAAAIAPGSRPA